MARDLTGPIPWPMWAASIRASRLRLIPRKTIVDPIDHGANCDNVQYVENRLKRPTIIEATSLARAEFSRPNMEAFLVTGEPFLLMFRPNEEAQNEFAERRGPGDGLGFECLDMRIAIEFNPAAHLARRSGGAHERAGSRRSG